LKNRVLAIILNERKSLIITSGGINWVSMARTPTSGVVARR
jgi:hypothetical protein